MKIVFASQNEGKVKEIRAQLGSEIELLSLNDIGFKDELAEDQDDLIGNAFQKARFVKEELGYDCFADDTGLEIDALNGEPGVKSARYAGELKDANDNMDLVLAKLQDQENRSARFKTVIALVLGNEEHAFEGVCEGSITTQKRGEKGFGYDPIFKAKGHDQTFAEMSIAEKSKISHRARAVVQLIAFLNQSKG